MHLLRLFRRQDDFSTRRIQARRWLLVESLEGRQLLSTFTVTNINDSGAGSLRQAILSSNATTGTTTNTISFNVGSGGTQTIALKSALPVVTHPVVIDATTQPGTGTAPRVVLNGSQAGSTAVGLDITADNSVVKGLVIDDFAGGGVLVSGAWGDSITADYVGVNAADNATAGNGTFGIRLTGGSFNNSITHDVISGNATADVDLNGASLNVVASDFIGTDVTGTKPLGNSGQGIHNGIDASGILIDNGANSNIIGGSTTAARNIIAANGYDGVHISSSSSGTVFEGNFIGTDVTGTKPLGNDRDGVEIDAGATDNTIGASTAGARNVISYNLNNGVALEGAGKGNLIQGDTINDNGTSADRGDGVYIDDSSYTTVSYCLIESNWGWGVLVTSSSNSSVSYNAVLFNGLGSISGA